MHQRYTAQTQRESAHGSVIPCACASPFCRSACACADLVDYPRFAFSLFSTLLYDSYVSSCEACRLDPTRCIGVRHPGTAGTIAHDSHKTHDTLLVKHIPPCLILLLLELGHTRLRGSNSRHCSPATRSDRGQLQRVRSPTSFRHATTTTHPPVSAQIPRTLKPVSPSPVAFPYSLPNTPARA